MCSMSVLCPLCAQTSFSSIDALRCSLIKAANGPLACPICHEMFLGLDKLTIHLFSHTNIMNVAAITTTNTTSTSTPNNNNKNISIPEATSESDNQNIKNVENLNTKEIENLNNQLQEKSQNIINCGSVSRKLNKIEEHFKNSQQQCSHNENKKNLVKNAKVVAETKEVTVNNLNYPPQQVVAVTAREREESKEIEHLTTCDICEFTFRNEELKNMHIRLVHQNFECHAQAPNTSTVNNCGIDHQTTTIQEHEFKCHLCSKTFKMKGSLRIHLKVVHLMGLPYVNNTLKLNICDRIRHKENKLLKSVNFVNTNTSPTTDNLLQNNNGNNSCATSSLLNIQPIDLMQNLNVLPAAASKVNLINFNQSLEFQQNHMENSTLQPQNVLLVFNTAPAAQQMTENINSFSNNMGSNISNAIPVTSTSPTNKETSSKLSITMAGAGNVVENPKIWECDVCSKAFTTKYFLKKHKRLHTGEMPYTCELCARTFTFQQSYHKHLLYHSDEKPHVCSTCGRAFKELSTLHNHERIHSGEKPFKCEVCGKNFRQRVSLLVHIRIHTGVMPYKCEICQKSFRYKVSQRTHKCHALSTEDSPPEHEQDTTIERMSESFIKEFLEKTVVANKSESHLNQSQNSPASSEIANINEKSAALNEQQVLLNKTIDDIVVESCNKMGIGSGTTGFSADHSINEGSMSPSQRLQNMRLYSPQLVTPDLNGDLTRFFLENSQNANNLL